MGNNEEKLEVVTKADAVGNTKAAAVAADAAAARLRERHTIFLVDVSKNQRWIALSCQARCSTRKRRRGASAGQSRARDRVRPAVSTGCGEGFMGPFCGWRGWCEVAPGFHEIWLFDRIRSACAAELAPRVNSSSNNRELHGEIEFAIHHRMRQM